MQKLFFAYGNEVYFHWRCILLLIFFILPYSLFHSSSNHYIATLEVTVESKIISFKAIRKSF